MREDSIAQREALGRAKEAAVKGDVPNFLRHLHESRFLDGAKRRLMSKYEGRLDNERVYEILTTGADRFYEALIKGKKVFAPESYLWKTIDNLALDVCKTEKNFVSLDKVGLEKISLPGSPTATDATEEEIGKEAEKSKQEGVQIARSLLPRIGSPNVQNVMAYIIDVVDAGVEDVTNREISEALGLSETSVRQWKKRGFERLKRVAIDAGYQKECFAGFGEDLEEEEKVVKQNLMEDIDGDEV